MQGLHTEKNVAKNRFTNRYLVIVICKRSLIQSCSCRLRTVYACNLELFISLFLAISSSVTSPADLIVHNLWIRTMMFREQPVALKCSPGVSLVLPRVLGQGLVLGIPRSSAFCNWAISVRSYQCPHLRFQITERFWLRLCSGGGGKQERRGQEKESG